MTTSSKDLVHLHFLVFLWGFTAILGLLINLGSVEIVLYRSALSSIGLLIILYFAKKSFVISVRNLIVLFGTGALISAHWILFFVSARVSNASVCLAGLATASLWTSFVEPIVFNRRIKLFEVILGLLVMAGLFIVFRAEFDHALGLALGVISALLMAIFSVINSKLAHSHDHYQLTFYEMIGATIGTALFLPFVPQIFNGYEISMTVNGSDVFYLIILSLVCTVYAFSASVEIMKRVSAFVVNLIVNLEPVYGIILAVIIFREHEGMHWGFYLGTLVILLSVLSYPMLNRYYQRRYMSVDSLR